MYRTLVPCPSCARHVLASETACPFCASALPIDLGARAVPSAPGRLSRAAAFVFGATMAVTGCSSTVDGDTSGSTGSAGGAGGGSGSTTSNGSGPDDDGGAMAHYGLPAPKDAGPSDDGGAMALYGVPAPQQDGGTATDGGGPHPVYGSPPPPPQQG